MKSKAPTLLSAALIAVLALPVRFCAQEQERREEKKEHVRYKLIDLGTFGGPQSFGDFGHGAANINNQGTAVGVADTPTSDPYYPNFNPLGFFQDSFVHHAFKTEHGALVDLGALPGTNSSSVNFIAQNGLITGQSLNGAIDPFTGWPAQDAVLWNGGQINNLGTLGGYESAGIAVNSRGQVAGFASNAIPDISSIVYSLFYGFSNGTQTRAFRWDKENGMQDLGTLGGSDAFAQFINEHGQIAGFSYTNLALTPTVNPFLWQHGTMIDLGTLGGTNGTPNGLNNRGQVAGTSNLTGDLIFHPFLWTAPGPMRDLGTLGGNFGFGNVINDAGAVAGGATMAGDLVLHAFLWKRGVMTDLGTVAGYDCIEAFGINSKSQVVGQAQTQCGALPGAFAFLWEDGHMIDLNVFVPPGSNLSVADVESINDRGEIFGSALHSNGDTHAILMIPCDAGEDDCMDNAEAATAAPPGAALIDPAQAAATKASLTSSEMKDRMRALLARRNRRFGALAPR